MRFFFAPQIDVERRRPGLVPVRTLCEARDEEVESALMAQSNGGKGRRVSNSLVERVSKEIDRLLRDPHFDRESLIDLGPAG